MGFILAILVSALSLAVIYFVISLFAYVLSLVIKRKWPLMGVTGAAVIVQIFVSLLLFVWFLLTAYTLFRDGEIIWGLIFVFFLGGLIVGIYSGFYSLLIGIPAYFLNKLEDRLAMHDKFIEGEAVDPKISAKSSKNAKIAVDDGSLVDWDDIK